jgi:hypothetical protein
LDLKRIVTELKTERDRLARAIGALEGLDLAKAPVRLNPPAFSTPARAMKKRGSITPAGRKRLSEIMKKRWAERRKKANQRG